MKQLIHELAVGITDDNGAPVSLGTVTFYEGGTTTPQTAYQELAFSTPHLNPATLDAGGRLIAYFDGRAKLLIKDSDGTPVRTIDQTGIEDADVSAAAAGVTAGQGLTSSPGGTIDVDPDNATIEINGLDQVAIKAGFLDITGPTTTKGDLITHNATTHTRLAVGTDGQVLSALASEPTGLKYISIAGLGADQSYEISNLAVAASVAGNALTIALKTKAGTDPTASDSCYIGFRNATLATGTYVRRTITAATSLVISSGSTLGLSSGSWNEYVYLYALDNAGTVELFAVGGAASVDEGEVVSTLAEGGAGGADTRYFYYSTSARSNVACRLLARLKFTLTTAGTWNEAPDEIALTPFSDNLMPYAELAMDTGNGHGSTNTKVRRLTNQVPLGAASSYFSYSDSGTGGGSLTILKEGRYQFTYADSAAGAFSAGISVGSAQLTTNIQSITTATRLTMNSASGLVASCTAVRRCKPSEVIRPHTDGGPDSTAATVQFRAVYLGP